MSCGIEQATPRLLTVRGVARFLSVSRSTVYRMVWAGSLPQPIRVGRRGVRWRIEDLEQFIRGQESGFVQGDLS